MPPQIQLNELYQMKKKKEQAKVLCYDRVIELCHRRIRNIAEFGGQNTFYEVPGMLVGYPLYNIYDCLQYVVEALRKSGFLVQILPPPHICVVYVSWDPNDLKPKFAPKAIMPPQQGNITPIVPGFQVPPRFITKTDMGQPKKKKHTF